MMPINHNQIAARVANQISKAASVSSSFMLTVVLLYFCLNTYVTCCNSSLASILVNDWHLIDFSSLPVISAPYDFLIRRGDPARAEMVKLVYSFNWITALFAILTMIILSVTIGLFFPKENIVRIHVTNSITDIDIKSLRESGYAIMAAAAIYVIIQSSIGSFDPDGKSGFRNIVHVRDADFYRVSVFLSLFMMFTILGFAVLTRWINQVKPTAIGGDPRSW